MVVSSMAMCVASSPTHSPRALATAQSTAIWLDCTPASRMWRSYTLETARAAIRRLPQMQSKPRGASSSTMSMASV